MSLRADAIVSVRGAIRAGVHKSYSLHAVVAAHDRPRSAEFATFSSEGRCAVVGLIGVIRVVEL